MHSDLEAVCVALDELATSVMGAIPDDRILTEVYGWVAPSVTRSDAAWLAKQLASDIREVDADAYPEELRPFVTHIPYRIGFLKAQVIPQIPAGNVAQAFSVYIDSLALFRARLLPAIGWIAISDESVLPIKLSKRAMTVRRQLDAVEVEMPELSKRIAEIELAHSLAENLPLDLESLAEARQKMAKTVAESSLQNVKINDNGVEARRHLRDIETNALAAEKLVEQCEEAYKITTTKGLAAAFDQRANSLSWSMRGWVIGLIAALITGSIIGSFRLTSLSAQLSSETPKWGLIAAQIILSVLSIGAPLWFSWLATKQIGQRFRLSEDYAFKASVAKAYEGYRKEAAKLDPEFSAKLFGSALQRLDEAPLRLVETEQHASPWQEFANSDAVRQAIKLAPDLQWKIAEVINGALKANTKVNEETAKIVSDASRAHAVSGD